MSVNLPDDVQIKDPVGQTATDRDPHLLAAVLWVTSVLLLPPAQVL